MAFGTDHLQPNAGIEHDEEDAESTASVRTLKPSPYVITSALYFYRVSSY